MAGTVCIFEGKGCEQLFPLAYTRPVYDLRCGISTLREKIQRSYPGAAFALHCRSYLTDVVRQETPGIPVNQIAGSSCLFIDGRIIADTTLADKIPLDGPDALYMDSRSGILLAARLSGPLLSSVTKSLSDAFALPADVQLPRKEILARVIHYPWDLITLNGECIGQDFAAIAGPERERIRGVVYDGAHLVNRSEIVLGNGSKVKPGAVLDAENGPIFIGNSVTIFPNATIEGPACIGDNTLIKIGAKIYENTSIGEMCKVGGEVEASILHSHANKQHDGFLGHSYLGKWVNLGADTNNSDLKNNYGTVRVIVNGESIDSGTMFVGLIMGDHSKSGINTMFNTGTVVGVSSNVFGAGFPPKYIPSFSWGGAEGFSTFDLTRGLDVARRVMARRKVTLTGADEALLRKVFTLTEVDRMREAGRDV